MKGENILIIVIKKKKIFQPVRKGFLNMMQEWERVEACTVFRIEK